MKYLLDANAWIGHLRQNNPYVTQCLSQHLALANNCTVVTHNIGEFSRVPGLTIEDWQVP